MRKSEPPIVVSIPGNAGGAKGWRFETACGRYTALHREDSVRDNCFRHASLGRRAVPVGQVRKRPAFRGSGRRESMDLYAHPIGNDSNSEPDGVTRQVRFCEEPGTNRRMGEIAWHRRETRRQTENTNFSLSDGKNPAALIIVPASARPSRAGGGVSRTRDAPTRCRPANASTSGFLAAIIKAGAHRGRRPLPRGTAYQASAGRSRSCSSALSRSISARAASLAWRSASCACRAASLAWRSASCACRAASLA